MLDINTKRYSINNTCHEPGFSCFVFFNSICRNNRKVKQKKKKKKKNFINNESKQK